MSHAYSSKPLQDSDKRELSLNASSPSSMKSLSTGSLLPNSSDSTQNMISNRRMVKSCFWSTTIFSINFTSSILVINLAKWYEYFLQWKSLWLFSFRIYVKHHFPNLTLTTINFFITSLFLIICLQFKLFSYTKLPILSMIPVSACFGGFIAFSNLSLQYNTVGTYQLIKLQVTPSE